MSELTNNIKSDLAELERLKKRIEELKSVLLLMDQAVKPKQFNELNKELGKTTILYEQLQKKLNPELFKGLKSGIEGVSGALSTAQGVATLFGKESETLNVAQEKVGASIKIVTGLTSLWNGATKVLNTQLGLSIGLSKGLVAGGIGLIIAGITAAILKYEEWKKKQEEIARINNIVSDSLIDASIQGEKAAIKESASLDILYKITQDETRSKQERLKVAKELQKTYPNYFGNLSQEEILLGKGANAYNTLSESILKVAKARAAANKITENQGKIIDLEAKKTGIETEKEKVEIRKTKYVEESKNLSGMPEESYAFHQSMINTVNKEIEDYENNLSILNNEITALETANKNLLNTIDIGDILPSSGSSNFNNLQNKENQITSDILRIQQEREELRISAIKDEGERVREQINIEYQKQIDEIKNQEAEWKETQKKLTPDQQVWVTQKTAYANEKKDFALAKQLEKEQKGLAEQSEKEQKNLDDLLKKYQDYAAKRFAIEKQYDDDIKTLQTQRDKAEEEGNKNQLEQLDRSMAQAVKNKGKSLISFDFNILKESPEYVRTFEDLKNASSETLGALLSQLEGMKSKASEVLNPAELKEYTSTIQQVIGELTTRNPFKALASAQNDLTKSNAALSVARNQLKNAQKAGDVEKIAEAEIKYKEALDDVTKSHNQVIKTQKEVNKQTGELYTALKGVGDSMGGTAGEVIGFIADIGLFVNTSIDGMRSASQAATASLRAVETASVILVIIQGAIQLMKSLDKLLPTAEAQYDKYAAKIGEINKLRDAVNEYEIAVIKAKHAEENWFSEDNLKELRQAKELNIKAEEAYFAKLREEQAIYQNKSGAGWFTKFADFTTIGLGDLFKNMPGWAKAITSDPWAGSLSNYKEGTTAAVNNLRIETRKASKGFLGSGIGGKSQKTEDLSTWVKNNLKEDLFDSTGLLNLDTANVVLNKYGDKLVGETKATLEELVKLREQYDEYLNTLHEYVSSLYSPLVDNFVDSLWDWFDEGKDALDSFKDYAAQTFRNIVTDMMRTIILKQVVGTYSDDISGLYEEYSAGHMTEEQLMEAVSKRTAGLISDYERNIPTLQNVMTTLTGSLENIGISLKPKEEETPASDNTLKGAYAKASQESVDLLAGQTGAARVVLEDIRTQMYTLDEGRGEILVPVIDSLNVIRDIQLNGWKDVFAIRELTAQVADNTDEIRRLSVNIADSNDNIAGNIGKVANRLQDTLDVKMKGGGLGL